VSLDIGESRFFVVKMGLGENGLSHRKSPMDSSLSLVVGVVKCNVARIVGSGSV
jgi:hypothetical protein